MISPRAKRPKCPRCLGRGYIVVVRRVSMIFGPVRERVTCPVCEGRRRMSHQDYIGGGR